jgi:hypothetical protein
MEPEASQHGIDTIGVTGDELREGVFVAGARALDQIVFGNRCAGKQAPTLYRVRADGAARRRPPPGLSSPPALARRS